MIRLDTKAEDRLIAAANAYAAERHPDGVVREVQVSLTSGIVVVILTRSTADGVAIDNGMPPRRNKRTKTSKPAPES